MYKIPLMCFSLFVVSSFNSKSYAKNKITHNIKSKFFSKGCKKHRYALKEMRHIKSKIKQTNKAETNKAQQKSTTCITGKKYESWITLLSAFFHQQLLLQEKQLRLLLHEYKIVHASKRAQYVKHMQNIFNHSFLYMKGIFRDNYKRASQKRVKIGVENGFTFSIKDVHFDLKVIYDHRYYEGQVRRLQNLLNQHGLPQAMPHQTMSQPDMLDQGMLQPNILNQNISVITGVHINF